LGWVPCLLFVPDFHVYKYYLPVYYWPWDVLLILVLEADLWEQEISSWETYTTRSKIEWCMWVDTWSMPTYFSFI
jgi:hypothetical protein